MWNIASSASVCSLYDDGTATMSHAHKYFTLHNNIYDLWICILAPTVHFTVELWALQCFIVPSVDNIYNSFFRIFKLMKNEHLKESELWLFLIFKRKSFDWKNTLAVNECYYLWWIHWIKPLFMHRFIRNIRRNAFRIIIAVMKRLFLCAPQKDPIYLWNYKIICLKVCNSNDSFYCREYIIFFFIISFSPPFSIAFLWTELRVWKTFVNNSFTLGMSFVYK